MRPFQGSLGVCLHAGFLLLPRLGLDLGFGLPSRLGLASLFFLRCLGFRLSSASTSALASTLASFFSAFSSGSLLASALAFSASLPPRPCPPGLPFVLGLRLLFLPRLGPAWPGRSRAQSALEDRGHRATLGVPDDNAHLAPAVEFELPQALAAQEGLLPVADDRPHVQPLAREFLGGQARPALPSVPRMRTLTPAPGVREGCGSSWGR